MPVCFENGAQKVDLPSEEEKFIQFRDIEKQMELPFVIYADFESILPEIEDDSTTNTKKLTNMKLVDSHSQPFHLFMTLTLCLIEDQMQGKNSCKKF